MSAEPLNPSDRIVAVPTLGEREAIARANLYAALPTTGIGTQGSFVARDVFETQWRRRGAR